jgi:phage N-6-adenine-methyltransferase
MQRHEDKSKPMNDLIAVGINEEHRLANESATTAVEHAIKCGKLLQQQKARLAHGEWQPWVKANCKFSYPSAKVYMNAARQKDRGLSFSSLAQLYGPASRGSVVEKYTGQADWQTPAQYVELAREVMGDIDLDPASSDAANDTIQAAEYFTTDDDGLSKLWHGRVFLNPPYCQPEVRLFTEKLLDELFHGRVTAAILLTNNSTDTAWWQDVALQAAAICFTRGRINFHDDSKRAGNTNGQTFMYFGGAVELFDGAFKDVGFCCRGM